MNTPTTLEGILHAAVQHHQSGDVSSASRLYERVLELDPTQSDALNLLAVITAQSGDIDRALKLFDRAATAAPNVANIPYNRANALRDAGQRDEARNAYETALGIDPNYADARLNLGVLLHDDGKPEAAIAQFNSLLAHAPNMAQAHYNLGKCRQTQGRLDDAKDALSQAIRLSPQDPDAHFAMANVLNDLGAHDDAIDHIKIAIKLKPNWSEAISTYGLILNRVGNYEEACERCERAIELQPENALLHFSLGCIHHNKGNFDLAKLAFSKAREKCRTKESDAAQLSTRALAELDPWTALEFLEDAMAYSTSEKILTYLHSCIGICFNRLDLNALATTYLDESLRSNPEYGPALAIRGKIKVSTNQFSEGWEDLTTLLDKTGAGLSIDDRLPLWRGEELGEKTVLITLQEGIGDQILFSTIIPEIVSRADLCIVECARRLVPILQRSFPDASVCDWQDQRLRAENRLKADYICPAYNLARYLRSSGDSFPSTVRHLTPNSELTAAFRRKYESEAAGRRIVGLSWLSGSQKNGAAKTIGLENLVSSIDADAVYLVSLQYGNIEEHLEQFTNDTGVHIYCDPTVNQLTDLESFFAQVAAMDLVLSISSTAAHVSGAQGVPTWLVLPRGSGILYYWGCESTDNIWYPSIRAFRQKAVPKVNVPWWPEVLENVKKAFHDWVSAPVVKRDRP